MTKYKLYHTVHGTIYEDIEAESAEEALDLAEGCASLCHHCSSEVELGDIDGTMVCNEDGDTLCEYPSYQDEVIKRLEQEVKELKEQIAELSK